MKKILTALLAGLVLGGGAVWFILHHPGGAAPAPAAKADEKPAAEEAGAGPTLTKEQQAGAGLAVATPTAITLPPEIPAYGRVLDPTPFVTLAAEAAVAQAALAASEKESDRVRMLHDQGENASTQAVEAAQAALQRDRVQLASARTRLLAGWGPALAQKADLAALAESLAHGDALVRLDAAAGDASATPVAARVGALTADEPNAAVDLLGPAPTADAQLQGTGYLALWREHALAAGTNLRAVLTLPGEPRHALVLPRSAFVRHEGSVWIYVQTATGSFERRRVELGRSLPAGSVVTAGVGEHDQVIVTGAQQLLSTELQASNAEPD